MRILVVNKYWRPFGGVESHIEEVTAFLTGLGHEIVPFAMAEPETDDSAYSDYFPSKVDFRGGGLKEKMRSVERSVRSKETSEKLNKLIDTERIDAAYVAHVYHQLGTKVLNILRSREIPMVMSIHDYKAGCPNYRLFSERTGMICTRCTDRPAARLWAPIVERCWDGSAVAGAALVLEAVATSARKSYKKPNVVVTLNSIQDEIAKRICGNDVVLRRIPHPVSLHPKPQIRRAEHVLYVGRLVPEKGVDVLIKACSEAGISLRIVGDGRDRNDLERLADSLPNSRATFVGKLAPEEIRNEMEQAACLAVPSIWHEVSPLVVLEAIASDLPVVASRVGGMVDQLSEGRGYLVEPGSPTHWTAELSAIMADPTGRADRSTEARRYAAANWNEAAWAQNFKDAFGVAGVML